MSDANRQGRTWLTIHEASDLIGVSPATLRRWAEAGDIKAFVTPGGHRRFERGTILGMLPTGPQPRRRLSDLGETVEHIVRQYRRELSGGAPSAGWIDALSEAERERFREPGRRILGGVLGFLDAATPDESEALLAGAVEASGRYGTMAREHGVEADVLTDTFLRFRLPFLHELGRIARRRRLPAEEATDLILAASRVFDRLLLALIQGHRDLPLRDPLVTEPLPGVGDGPRRETGRARRLTAPGHQP
jgi:excisionase family DNA binding protein